MIRRKNIEDLVPELLERVLQGLLQQDLVELGRTSLFFNYHCNRRLYEDIMIVDVKMEDDIVGVVAVDRMPEFTRGLLWRTLQFVKRIAMYSQSTAELHDYGELYEGIRRYMEQSLRAIEIASYDVGNLRGFQSINSHFSKRATKYEENEEDETVSIRVGSSALRTLKNWTVIDVGELLLIPSDTNVRTLNLFIEQMPQGNITDLSLALPCQSLEELYLSLPCSTRLFCGPLVPRRRLTLRKLSITNSHTFKHNSRLLFEDIERAVDMLCLEELELKLSCSNYGCSERCIVRFFEHLQTSTDLSGLRALSIINFKSNTSPGNLQQFSEVLDCFLDASKLCNLRHLYINICDLASLPEEATGLFKLNNLIRRLQTFESLESLCIPDFFTSWIHSIHEVISAPDSSDTLSLLVNRCPCEYCASNRALFNHLAHYDCSNYYMHNFDNLDLSTVPLADSDIDTTKKSIYKFLQYLLGQYKATYFYAYQNLHSIGSLLHSSTASVSLFPPLSSLKNLFIHSVIIPLFQAISFCVDNLKCLTLGGISYTV